jgi:L-lactate dehydrogenase (cytochrome)/(S)-mandelate dehydrogenase
MSRLAFRWSRSRDPISIEDYRLRAKAVLPQAIWEFVEGAADDHVTASSNLEAFSRRTLRTRVLAGHATPRLGVTVAGVELALPVVLAPTGGTGFVHWTGEVGAALAAERAGTRAIVSTVATYSLEEVAERTAENHFFQVFPWPPVGSATSETARSLVRRADRRGFAALVVTVDVPVLGNRESARRRGGGVPPVLTPWAIVDAALHPGWLYRFVKHRQTVLPSLARHDSGSEGADLVRADADWDGVARIREEWSRPLLVKGVLSADDAERAVELGAEGVIVSNHGGRQLDGAIASLDALPAIAERIGGRADILLDGGVRRGSDIVKALCLGATAVCIGRPYLYGLAAAGPEGAGDVLEIFRAEIGRTVTLMGANDVRALDASWVAGPDA